MKLIMPALEFVSVDDVPREWKDGRPLLAFGSHRTWEDWASDNWAVIAWASGVWMVMETTEGENSDGSRYGGDEHVFKPAWLAELPVNMEACEVTE